MKISEEKSITSQIYKQSDLRKTAPDALFGMHDAFKTSLENTIKEKMQYQFVSHLVQSELQS